MIDYLQYQKLNEFSLSKDEGTFTLEDLSGSNNDSRYSIVRSTALETGENYLYHGWDHNNNRGVKIKMPLYWKCPEKSDIKNSLIFKSYLEEAWILNLVRHQNVVEIYDFIITDIYDRAVPVVIMEEIEGEDLFAYSTLSSRTIEEKVNLIDILANTVDFCHSKGVLHCDLNPKNIRILHDDTKLKITDFKNSKLIETKRTAYSPGFPGFAPKSVVEGKDWTKEDDIWSFTANVFYILSNGKFPFGRSRNPENTYLFVKDSNNLLTFEKELDDNLGLTLEQKRGLDLIFQKILAKRDSSYSSCKKVFEEIRRII
jgi:serine/threonine protein kinase